MSKLRVGIVGCGRISIMYKLAFQNLSDRIEVVIAVDKDLEKAKAFAANFGCGFLSGGFEGETRCPSFVHAPLSPCQHGN